jgi:hypothetical protein
MLLRYTVKTAAYSGVSCDETLQCSGWPKTRTQMATLPSRRWYSGSRWGSLTCWSAPTISENDTNFSPQPIWRATLSARWGMNVRLTRGAGLEFPRANNWPGCAILVILWTTDWSDLWSVQATRRGEAAAGRFQPRQLSKGDWELEQLVMVRPIPRSGERMPSSSFSSSRTYTLNYYRDSDQSSHAFDSDDVFCLTCSG